MKRSSKRYSGKAVKVIEGIEDIKNTKYPEQLQLTGKGLVLNKAFRFS